MESHIGSTGLIKRITGIISAAASRYFVGKELYLLHVYRKKVDYPALKRAVVEQAQLWSPRVVVIEDKASGTQLIQELCYECVYNIQRYQPGPNQDKTMRMYGCCNIIENGFVYLPEQADWLTDYLNELTVFPNGKRDDQVDSTSQALDWINGVYLESQRHTVTITTVRSLRNFSQHCLTLLVGL